MLLQTIGTLDFHTFLYRLNSRFTGVRMKHFNGLTITHRDTSLFPVHVVFMTLHMTT